MYRNHLLLHTQFLRSAAKMSVSGPGSNGGGVNGGRGGGGGPGRPRGVAKPPPDERVNSNITCEHGGLVSSR